MKKHIFKTLTALVLVTIITSCKNNTKTTTVTKTTNNSFSITGKVKGLDKGTIEITYNKKNGWGSDAVPVVNGHFSYTGKIEYPYHPHIGYISLLEGEDDHTSTIFLENTDMEIEVDTTKTEKFVIKGSTAHSEYLAFKELTEAPFEDQLNTLYRRYNALKISKERDRINEEIKSIDAKIVDIKKQYIDEHPASFVAAIALFDIYGYNPDFINYKTAYDKLDNLIKTSSLGEKFERALAIAKKTQIGQPAIDLTINDTNGNPLTLSSLKGKYVLLDFWSSGCGSCRDENQFIKKAYALYKSKGFEVYAVSLDRDKKYWLEAIEEDGATWLNVSDLRGKDQASEAYGLYGGIPMNYLLDKDGRIIAKALRGDELLKKLEELL